MTYHKKPWHGYADAIVPNGYSPVAVIPGTKEPRFRNWPKACAGFPDLPWIRRHAKKAPHDSVGIACGTSHDKDGHDLGRIIAVDIDADDPAEAERIERLVVQHLGPTPLVRTRTDSPRRLLVYRCKAWVAARKLNKVDLLGTDRQFVAYGWHPDGGFYTWRGKSPATLPVAKIPVVSLDQLSALRQAIEPRLVEARATKTSRRTGACPDAPDRLRQVVEAGGTGELEWTVQGGRVTDGREAFLTWCAAKAGGDPHRTWAIFEEYALLDRPKGSVRRRGLWTLEDAEAKSKAYRRNVARRRDGKRAPGRPRTPHREPLSVMQRVHHKVAVRRAHLVEGRIGRAAVTLSNAMHALAAGDHGACTASVATLSRTVHLSRSTVNSARAELVRAGLWAKAHKGRETGCYWPILPPGFSEAQPVVAEAEISDAVPSLSGHYASGVSMEAKPPSPIPNPLSSSVAPLEQVGQGQKITPPDPGNDNSLPEPSEPEVLGFVLEFQPDLFGARVVDLTALGRGGVLAVEVRQAVQAFMRAHDLTQHHLAQLVGLSRPQLGNALTGRFGLSLAAAQRLVAFLMAA